MPVVSTTDFRFPPNALLARAARRRPGREEQDRVSHREPWGTPHGKKLPPLRG
ncbi:hypothetical protein K227x_23460 [Rubripirellula lacrimiformis]|uniref:Uncharacterized protein n=1 Tax=Rubripirellula lacrimiformis TaxID=1930273 RepID=A0A517NA02_9BACT|nr:hypothetical protein K227x_23460 [Rubripirellula lacrimiformis]